jgi:hypothetical protein
MAHSKEIKKSSIKGNHLIKTLSEIADCSSNTLNTTVDELAIHQYLKKLSPKNLQKIGNLAFQIRLDKLEKGER